MLFLRSEFGLHHHHIASGALNHVLGDGAQEEPLDPLDGTLVNVEAVDPELGGEIDDVFFVDFLQAPCQFPKPIQKWAHPLLLSRKITSLDSFRMILLSPLLISITTKSTLQERRSWRRHCNPTPPSPLLVYQLTKSGIRA